MSCAVSGGASGVDTYANEFHERSLWHLSIQSAAGATPSTGPIIVTNIHHRNTLSAAHLTSHHTRQQCNRSSSSSSSTAANSTNHPLYFFLLCDTRKLLHLSDSLLTQLYLISLAPLPLPTWISEVPTRTFHHRSKKRCKRSMMVSSSVLSHTFAICVHNLAPHIRSPIVFIHSVAALHAIMQ